MVIKKSNAFLKESGLFDLGFQLKQTHHADEIPPGFCGSLLLEEFYRITRPMDREAWLDFRQLRNSYLRHAAIRYMLCAALMLGLSVAALLLPGQTSPGTVRALLICAVLSFVSLAYHAFGWCFLKRRWNRYFERGQETQGSVLCVGKQEEL